MKNALNFRSRSSQAQATVTGVVASLIACIFATGSAEAGIFLNGGIMSRVDNTGANVTEPYEFDSFNTPNADLRFNGLTGTPILLAVGLNSFQVTGHGPLDDGLGLFFTSDNTLLSTNGLAPDLYVHLPSAGGFAFAAAGTQVATLGPFSGNAPYSGATSFIVDDREVTVTAWDHSTLTLQVTEVTAVPEPSSAILLSVCSGIAAFWRRRR